MVYLKIHRNSHSYHCDGHHVLHHDKHLAEDHLRLAPERAANHVDRL